MSVHSVCIVSVCGLSGVCVRVRACLECGMCQVRVWHVCARALCVADWEKLKGEQGRFHREKRAD